MLQQFELCSVGMILLLLLSSGCCNLEKWLTLCFLSCPIYSSTAEDDS